MPSAVAFTQDAMRVLLMPEPPLSKKEADNRIARLLHIKPSKVGRWRRGERCPNPDELLALIVCVREQTSQRRKVFHEMERKAAIVLPEVGGADIGPLGDLVRRACDQDC